LPEVERVQLKKSSFESRISRVLEMAVEDD
jgi:hypothetical protein